MFLDSEFVAMLDALPEATQLILTWTEANVGLASSTLTVDRLIAGRSTARLRLPAHPGGIVLLTSGTTGIPRGTPRRKISPLQAAQILDRVPLSRRGTMVIAVPLFHGTGLAQLTLAMTLGKRVVLQQPKFGPEATLAALAEHRADTLVVVPTMLQRMLDLGSSALIKCDVSRLRIIVCAGSALSPDLCLRTSEVFGEVLYNVYGSTEVANVAVATPADLRQSPGTVGRTPIGCRLAIYDHKRSLVRTPDTPGTIFVSTGGASVRYTDGGQKETLDGMVSTGDVGHFNGSGLLFVDGREDDMIVSGGENVFPLEVENLLASRPDIREVAVVGVDDRDFGKRLSAFIVPSLDAARDPDEIRAYVKANLARYKTPRRRLFVDHIPRNATGKALRRKPEQIQPD